MTNFPPDLPMSLQAYLAFVAACIALALIPGPVVTLVIANGLRHGTRAALTNIAGVQAGLDDRDRHRRGRPDHADGDHGLLVRLGAVCRRRLSGLARHQAGPLSRRRRQRRRAATAAARRVLPAGFSGAALEPESAGVLRRVHSAVHGHEQGSFLAGGAARLHLHGHGRDHRFDLRAAGRPRPDVLLGAADAAAVANLRRLHDRRRHLAGADPGALSAADFEPAAEGASNLTPSLGKHPCLICRGSSI